MNINRLEKYIAISLLCLYVLLIYIFEQYVPFSSLPNWMKMILFPILFIGAPFSLYIVYQFGEYVGVILKYKILGYKFISDKNGIYYEIIDNNGNHIDKIYKRML